MRITRRAYEKAKVSVKAAQEQMKIVNAWNEATRQLGNIGNQKLVAITVNEDGSIRTECELVNDAGTKSVDETAKRIPAETRDTA